MNNLRKLTILALFALNCLTVMVAASPKVNEYEGQHRVATTVTASAGKVSYSDLS
jgi:hypothetical protein